MISKEQRDFLLLFKCIIDVAADVVRDFADRKTGPVQETYFDNVLHQLFHVWDKKKSLCCKCPPGGCCYPRTGKMDSNTFNKIFKYDNRVKMPKGHHITTNGIVKQKCICRYVTNSDISKQLDLSDMNFLLVTLNLTNQTENDQIVKIMDIRNKICHAVNTDDFSSSKLSVMWNDLEIAITNLSEKAAVKYITKIISMTKNSILSETEAEQMMTKISELEEEKAKKSTENAEIMKRLEEITCNNNKQNETVITELQHLKEGKIKETEHRKLVSDKLQNIEDSFVEQNVKIDNLAALLSTGFKPLNAAHEANTQMKIDGLPEKSENILMKLKRGVLSKLPFRVSNSDVQITNVELGCLLFDLKLDIDTFDNSTKLLSSIQSILQTVLKMAEVDTSIDRTIKVELMFDDSLTQAQKEIVRGMLSSYAVDAEIVDSSNAKQQVVVIETANTDEDIQTEENSVQDEAKTQRMENFAYENLKLKTEIEQMKKLHTLNIDTLKEKHAKELKSIVEELEKMKLMSDTLKERHAKELTAVVEELEKMKLISEGNRERTERVETDTENQRTDVISPTVSSAAKRKGWNDVSIIYIDKGRISTREAAYLKDYITTDDIKVEMFEYNMVSGDVVDKKVKNLLQDNRLVIICKGFGSVRLDKISTSPDYKNRIIIVSDEYVYYRMRALDINRSDPLQPLIFSEDLRNVSNLRLTVELSVKYLRLVLPK